MKRVILLLVLMLAAGIAAAQNLRSSDVLLADDGTLFRIEAISPSDFSFGEPGEALETPSSTILHLLRQRDGKTDSFVVPASLSGGWNNEPSLAYDDEDRRLYVFWQRNPTITSSELMVASYKDGDEWSEPTSFANETWTYRFNLKVTTTRYVHRENEDGTYERTAASIAHAVWWEQAGSKEVARYALMELVGGVPRSLNIHSAFEFVTEYDSVPAELEEDFDRNLLRTPFMFGSPSEDEVEVVFGDWTLNRYHVVLIKPVRTKDGVLTIPIGVSAGEMDVPRIRHRDIASNFVAVRPPAGGGVAKSLLIYRKNESSIDYAVFRDGQWSSPKQLVLDAVTEIEAIDVLGRHIAQHR